MSRSLPIFFDGYKLVSSLVASRQQHDDMLQFAARHGIKPKIEVYPHNGVESVNMGFEKLKAGTPRYRVVLAF
jgi:D-arabinose 1-dehydrogenase-like Zn-dependent alcohol dehydrogenase